MDLSYNLDCFHGCDDDQIVALILKQERKRAKVSKKLFQHIPMNLTSIMHMY